MLWELAKVFDRNCEKTLKTIATLTREGNNNSLNTRRSAFIPSTWIPDFMKIDDTSCK